MKCIAERVVAVVAAVVADGPIPRRVPKTATDQPQNEAIDKGELSRIFLDFFSPLGSGDFVPEAFRQGRLRH